MARFVRDEHGTPELERLCELAGVQPSDFDGRSHWIALEQAESFLSAARDLVDSDNDFIDANGYQLKEALGPLRFILRATGPRSVLTRTAGTSELVSNFFQVQVAGSGRGWIRMHYESTQPESRLMCLSRQGFSVHLPTIWDLPPMVVQEGACIAWGDSHCDYLYKFYEPVRWTPPLVGAFLGTSLVGVLSLFTPWLWSSLALIPLGMLVAYTIELRRSHGDNLRLAAALNGQLETALAQETETAKELTAMHQRERAWTRGQQETSRRKARNYYAAWQRVQSEAAAREATIRGVSHDLRSPLTVLRTIGEVLEEKREVFDEIDDELVDDHGRAINRMERMITELLDSLTGTSVASFSMAPEPIDVTELANSLGRRLRALVTRQSVHTSVFTSRTAPEFMNADPTVIDRVLDNILTNAAKYTERGSIMVKVSGSPDQSETIFTISDTGRGIAESDIEDVFEAEGSKPGERAPQSYGVGLSIVKQLLAQTGGRLEVASQSGKGTTFWIHLPTDFERASPHDDVESVVTIRPTPAEARSH